MDTATILIVVVLCVVVGGFVSLLRYIKSQTAVPDNQGLVMIQSQMNAQLERMQELRNSLETRLAEANRQSMTVIGDVRERLGKLDETNRQVLGSVQDLSGLQDILKNPKQRGVLGEIYLGALLENVLGPTGYKLQYEFKDGTIVDAVVIVKNKIIPIDSKFSLENYNRLAEEKDSVERVRLEKVFKQDLKNRIDETAKYVKPGEGTMDFAFMFIPHEAIYYDLLVAQVGAVKVNTRDLIDYAFKEKHVIIVSPTSFLAYLQTVLQGLRALQIEETAKDIIKAVEAFGRHFISYNEYMKKLGGHLGTTVNTFNIAYKELGKVGKDVARITDSTTTVEPQLLERPANDEE